jgi:hypothetical protein
MTQEHVGTFIGQTREQVIPASNHFKLNPALNSQSYKDVTTREPHPLELEFGDFCAKLAQELLQKFGPNYAITINSLEYRIEDKSLKVEASRN